MACMGSSAVEEPGEAHGGESVNDYGPDGQFQFRAGGPQVARRLPVPRDVDVDAAGERWAGRGARICSLCSLFCSLRGAQVGGWFAHYLLIICSLRQPAHNEQIMSK